MEYRQLGRTGLEVSALGFGCGAVGGLLVRGDRGDMVRVVARAIESGINYFDTANDETLVVIMIETRRGVENIDSIFSVEGIDACFVGPSDLTLDMGIHRRYEHPDFTAALDRIVEAGEEITEEKAEKIKGKRISS